jgi:hemerythrin
LKTENLPVNTNLISNFKVYNHKLDLAVIDMDALITIPGNPLKDMLDSRTKSHFPFILICGQVTKDELIYFASLGIEDIIMKPFSDLDLMAKVLKYTSAPTYKDLDSLHTVEQAASNLLVWREELSVHDTIIDQEHQMIIEKFNHLYTLMKNGKGHKYYPQLIEFLNQYIETHFSNEEALQASIQYPLYEEHKVLHKAFTDQIRSIVEIHDPEHVSNQALISINLFLKNWLLHHILTEDMKISHFIKENNLEK